MYFILVIVFFLATLLYLVFTKPVNASFLFDSNRMELHVSAIWLSILSVQAEMMGLEAHVSAFLFRNQIMSKILRFKRNRNRITMQVLALSDIRVKTFYGLHEPHAAGIFYGIVSIISSFFPAVSLEQYAEFVTGQDYLQLEGTSELNLGKTMANALALKLKK